VRHISLAVWILILLLPATFAVGPCAATTSSLSGQIGFPSEREEPKSPEVREQERQQAKAMNKERHENLKRDADKLLQLATELKLYVDKTNDQTLSLDVVKKAEEIEKLSRSVQKKMRGY
jgi:nitric oxide reductase activation protein